MKAARVYFLLLMVSVLVLGNSTTAAGAQMAVSGINTWDSRCEIRGYGVYARSRMYAKQAPQDQEWVNRANTYNDQYDVYIDGTRRYTWPTTGMTSSFASVGSERFTASDHNKGAWRYVQWMDFDGGYLWRYWPHGYGLLLSNPDPTYRFYNNYVDRADHYVYCDDHLN